MAWSMKTWKKAQADAKVQALSCGEAWAEAEGKGQFHLADQLQRRAHAWAEVAEKIEDATRSLPE